MRCVVPLILLALQAFSQVTRFQPPVKINSRGKPITLPAGFAAPLYTDWDGDGVNDLLVGIFYLGGIKYYRNKGTNENPVLTHTYSSAIDYLYAGGSKIRMPAG